MEKERLMTNWLANMRLKLFHKRKSRTQFDNGGQLARKGKVQSKHVSKFLNRLAITIYHFQNYRLWSAFVEKVVLIIDLLPKIH